MFRNYFWLGISVLIFSSGLLFAQPEQKVTPEQYRFLQKAKLIGEAINSHNTEAIVAEFDELLKRDLPVEKLRPLLYQMTDSLGMVDKMGEVTLKWKGVGVIPVLFKKGFLDMQLALNADDKITGIYFLPHRFERPVPERNHVQLRLPFKGKWNVVWGGDNQEDNYHHNVKNQRYAMDFNILDDIGRSRIGDETKNESFFDFGKEIYAPAAGIVTEAIDGVRDNPPFLANEYSAVGNCVIIQHSDSEYSVLAHLKQGSVKVKKGDRVEEGDVIGLCGNSGNSTEPHLHYHLQNSPMLSDATGIKVFFSKVEVSNKKTPPHTESEYSPSKADKVERK